MKMRHVMLNFPETVLVPGEQRSVEFQFSEWQAFRAEKLVMIGFMEEIRGHFKIRHTRIPLLNRENVIAYSNVTKNRRKRRTTVEYREGAKGNFVRSYLPENVKYVHTDPLSYVRLLQIYCGKERALASSTGGVDATYFGANVLGNGFPAPSARSSIALELKNKGDIKVRVHATVFGTAVE